jgi:hypothetical protein
MTRRRGRLESKRGARATAKRERDMVGREDCDLGFGGGTVATAYIWSRGCDGELG